MKYSSIIWTHYGLPLGLHTLTRATILYALLAIIFMGFTYNIVAFIVIRKIISSVCIPIAALLLTMHSISLYSTEVSLLGQLACVLKESINSEQFELFHLMCKFLLLSLHYDVSKLLTDPN